MRDPYRVLLVTGSYPPMRCGVGDYTASLARALGRSKLVEVHVLTTQEAAGSTSDQQAGVAIHADVPAWSWTAAPAIVRLVKRLRPHLVHMQFPTQGYGRNRFPWALPPLLRLLGVRVVQTWHEFLPSPTHSLSLLQASSGGEVIVVRPNYLEHLAPMYQQLFKRRHIHYIAGGPSIPGSTLSADQRRALRNTFAADDERLIAFFGFALPNKNVELLFQVSDAKRDRLLFICGLDSADAYQAQLLHQVEQSPWRGRATVTGYAPPERAADLIAAADAVVLPFRDGGGEWNSSLQAARLQGTFVVTTSQQRRGYDAAENVFYCAIGDVGAMRAGLNQYCGVRRPAMTAETRWDAIAAEHMKVYALAGGR